jgi:hypothetical protein
MKVNFLHKRRVITVVSLICLFSLMFSSTGGLQVDAAAKTSYTKDELTGYAKGIVDWKLSVEGLPGNADLVSDVLCGDPGTTESDWFVLAMARLGLSADYGDYLSALTQAVQSRYQSASRLSSAKATEWHRIALTALACGGDPVSIGGNIDLIADGTYNRGLTKPLDYQGNNGPVYALIALDSMNYSVPADAYETRPQMIQRILDSQLEDGGFAQSGGASDVDMTAMALTSLAPYAGRYSSAIQRGLSFLSQKQTSGGGFSSGGVENAESTAQVIIALTSLGINPQTDARFIKQDRSAVEALTGYVTQSGGVRHTADSAENDMAAQQSLCALAALILQMNGQGGFYRFTGEAPPMPGEEPVDSMPLQGAAAADSERAAGETAARSAEEDQIQTAEQAEPQESIIEKPEPLGGFLWETSGFSALLGSAAALCFFIAAKVPKGRRRNILIIAGFAWTLAAVFLLARPQTVEDHYQAGGSQDTGQTVTLSIDCSMIYEHWEELDENLQQGGYWPEDGFILPRTEYPLEAGDTVWTVLYKAAREKHIHLDYQGGDENVYNTVYVSGLQYLYEFSCGELSGWTYSVNGIFPDVGCSSYTLDAGDVVQWLYTCDLGRDVGNTETEESQ